MAISSDENMLAGGEGLAKYHYLTNMFQLPNVHSMVVTGLYFRR